MTYTTDMIREAAPKTTTGRKVAAWMTGILNAYGSAHFSRVVRTNVARVPNPNHCSKFEWIAWTTFSALSDAVTPVRRVREYTDTDEAAAKATRRQFIESGRAVSLLGFDTERGVYAFDVLN